MGVPRLGWNSETCFLFFAYRTQNTSGINIWHWISTSETHWILGISSVLLSFCFLCKTRICSDKYVARSFQNCISKVSHIHLADPKYHTKVIPILREPILWLVLLNPVDSANFITEAIHSKLSRQYSILMGYAYGMTKSFPSGIGILNRRNDSPCKWKSRKFEILIRNFCHVLVLI